MAASYDTAFFDEMDDPNFASARVVVPLVVDLLHPKSVVDVGCGRGLWLKAFIECGITDVAGYDGEYVERDKLMFPKERFHAVDIEQSIQAGRTFDLAVCLEVGEHVPDSAATILVASLTQAAPVVVFSAAIPLQGGSHHINEQWPAYWEKKFATRGYAPVDALRRHIWGDERISFFYQQNILLYVRKADLAKYPKLQEEIRSGHGKALALVHPAKYLDYAERWHLVMPLLGALPPSILHIGKRLLKIMPIGHLIRYLVSGGLAAGAYFAVLYGLVEWGGMYYLVASTIALTMAIVVSFSLHKFFTFRAHELTHTHIQFGLYLGVAAMDYGINIAVLWFTVSVINIPYLLGAFIASAVIAAVNFFAYWFIVFKKR